MNSKTSDEVLGRSRGGFTTKLHLLCDSKGHPLDACVTPEQDHESQSLIPLLEQTEIRGDLQVVPLHSQALAGDHSYRADWIDKYLIQRTIKPVIPSRSNEVRDRQVPEFNRQAYRQRNVAARLIGWLKKSRRVATRFEKRASNYLGMIKLAFIHRFLRLIV